MCDAAGLGARGGGVDLHNPAAASLAEREDAPVTPDTFSSAYSAQDEHSARFREKRYFTGLHFLHTFPASVTSRRR